MQTLGTATSPDRYARLTIKERILAEVVRRLETADWSLSTVTFGKIVRHPMPDGFDAKAGAALSVLDGGESYKVNTTGYENEARVMFEFTLRVGAKEVASTVLNLICGELIEKVGGNHSMREGGKEDGEVLACTFYPETFEPDVEDAASGGAVTGLLTFRLSYRHKNHRPFELR